MSSEIYSEEEIVEGCRQGKRRFQELLYRRFAPKMYGICLSYAGERTLAQDILQEAFIKIFNKMDSFKAEGSIEWWIRRIVINTAIDFLRSRTKFDTFMDKEVEGITSQVENDALPNMQLKRLLHLIAKLPHGARVVFNLFALEGFNHNEIAQQLNISVGTSKSQYNRARNLLKSWLGDINS
jgi:RNA polymerase sigma-70 factor (ECF subfamily)